MIALQELAERNGQVYVPKEVCFKLMVSVTLCLFEVSRHESSLSFAALV